MLQLADNAPATDGASSTKRRIVAPRGDTLSGQQNEGVRMPDNTPKSDALIIGTGLAGLVAAAELVRASKHVTIVDQEPEASFGGQAWWSFGGLFFIDSPE